MAADHDDRNSLRRVSYDLAWAEFIGLADLTRLERRDGARLLRWYIALLVAAGETNPRKIARSALGMTRECQQKSRSKARVDLSGRRAA